MSNRDTAILVVNGGKDPKEGKWLSLFLENLSKYTEPERYNLLVWNNNINDKNVSELEKQFEFYLVEPFPGESFFHPHAVPLQRLFDIAVKKFQSKYIIVMDSDAFPIKKGWFEALVTGVSSNHYGLAGVWRDELSHGIPPYTHPSCMCFSSNFVLDNHLRLDYFGSNENGNMCDTLSSFTDKALELHLPILKWKRSNINNFHRLMGGIYGDYIYHHGAGSRSDIGFWDEEYSPEKSNLYKKISSESSKYLFQDLDSYLSWLKGANFNFKFSEALSEEKSTTSEIKRKSFFKTLKKYSKKAINHFIKRKSHLETFETETFNNMVSIPSIGKINQLPMPKGWFTSFPDIVGLGVPKAGTSWWFDLILNHPHIVPHRFYDSKIDTSKELNFFTHLEHEKITDFQKQIYRNCFLKQEGVKCAEFSTIYLSNIGSIDNLLQTVSDDAILVIILRNPIDRYFSHINHVLSNRAKLLEEDSFKMELFKRHSVIPEAHHYSMYSEPISILFNKVSSHRIFIDLYENIVSNPKGAYERLIDFIGLELYPSLEIDFKFSKNRQRYNIKRPTLDERQLISAYFKDDVQRLKKLLPEKDFSLWEEF